MSAGGVQGIEMKLFRWIVVAMLGLHTFSVALSLGLDLLYKSGLDDRSSDEELMTALIDATDPVVLIASTVMLAFYAVGVLGLMTRRWTGWPLLTAAWITDSGIVLAMQGKPAYQAAISPSEQQNTWVFLIAWGFAVAAAGWLERGRRSPGSLKGRKPELI